MNGRVVVGVDGSDSGAEALRWAAREASLRDWSVVAVLGAGYVDPVHLIDPVRGHDYDETEAQAQLSARVLAALGEAPAVTVDQLVVRDLGAVALLEAARGAEMLVVGARGLDGFRGLLLGSVSQQCVHHATVPVVVVHGADSHPTPGGVVVGVDSSEVARDALRWAVEEARIRHAELEVVHSWHVPYSGAYPYAAIVTDPGPLEAAATALVDSELSSIDTSGLIGPIRRTICIDSARTALIEASRSAELVVVGSRGVGGFRGMLLGSVCHAVSQHALCPVLVIPGSQA